jgi:hypothetical protein
VNVAGLPDKDFDSDFPTRRYLGGLFSIPIGTDGWKFEMGGITTPRIATGPTKGVYNEGYAKLSYEVLKRRDYELTLNVRFDAATCLGASRRATTCCGALLGASGRAATSCGGATDRGTTRGRVYYRQPPARTGNDLQRHR